MRKLTIETPNTEVDVDKWEIYMNHKSLNDLIQENMEHGRFHAKVTIIIEEVEPLIIESNKPEPEPEPEQEPKEETEQE